MEMCTAAPATWIQTSLQGRNGKSHKSSEFFLLSEFDSTFALRVKSIVCLIRHTQKVKSMQDLIEYA